MTWYPRTETDMTITDDLNVQDDLDVDGDLNVDGNVVIDGTSLHTGVATFTATPVTAAGITDDGGLLFVGYAAAAVQQALSGAGVVNLTTYYTAVTNTGADALTLADGIKGQLKKVKMVADPGTDSTLTFNGTATIVFADVGDYAVLLFNGSDWIPIELGNDADGATAPAYTPAA